MSQQFVISPLDFYGALFLAVIALLVNEHYELLQQEASAFAEDYKDSNFAWIASFVGSLLALTIGDYDGIWPTLIVVSAFILPAGIHTLRNYPFSLFCNYISYDDKTGKKVIGESNQNIAKKTKSGIYRLDFEVETGTAIDRYRVEVQLPEGVEASLDPPPGDHELTDDNIMTGEAPLTHPQFQTGLIVRPTTGLDHGRENKVILVDEPSGRVLESVTLVSG